MHDLVLAYFLPSYHWKADFVYELSEQFEKSEHLDRNILVKFVACAQYPASFFVMSVLSCILPAFLFFFALISIILQCSHICFSFYFIILVVYF